MLYYLFGENILEKDENKSEIKAQTNKSKNISIIKKENENINTNTSNIEKKKQNYYRPNQNYNRPSEDLLISVVVPLLNEEESLPELSIALEKELDNIAPNRWEVIFIDDGSSDSSYEVIQQIHNKNRRFKAIRFRRNYDKSAALAVGFKQSRGKVVITMDADLQDDPAEIPNLVAKIKEGYDLVSGWKKVRHDPLGKTMPSKLFNFF